MTMDLLTSMNEIKMNNLTIFKINNISNSISENHIIIDYTIKWMVYVHLGPYTFYNTFY